IVRDRQSGNGVFVNGKRIESATVDRALTITLGADGPSVTLEVEAPAVPGSARPPPPGARGGTLVYAQPHGNADHDNKPGRHRTMMIGKAIQKVQKKQQRKYAWIVALVAALAVAAIGYAVYSRQQIAKQKLIAEDLFYSIKTLDVEIAKLEERLSPTDATSQ